MFPFLISLTGCASRRAPFEGFASEQLAVDESVRLVFIGDTGAEADGEGSHITRDALDQLRENVRAEDADAIFALGDLVYGVGGPLELSPSCRDPNKGKAEELLRGRLGEYYADLGAETWLVLGNHDVGHYSYSRDRARCLMAYAEQTDHLNLPAAKYTIDLGDGLGRVVVMDTNVSPKKWDADEVRAAMPDEGWSVMLGHHVFRTAFDKEDEQQKGEHRYRAWMAAHDIQPSIWLNGHAHFLQFGIYDDVPAATSGSGSKIRERPTCPGDAACEGEDMPIFSQSVYGYAVIDLDPQRLTLTFKNTDGEDLYCWQRTLDDPRGQPCPVATN
ncbi:MAG: metallophosphoesterase [Myxococcota bacterium]